MRGEEKPVQIRLHNIKARFQVSEPVTGFAQILGQPRPVNNFTVHRKKGLENVVFTVFDNSRWVNITGLSQFDRLSREVSAFCDEFSLELTPGSLRVDSTTSTGWLPNIDRSLLTRLAIEYRRDMHRCPFAIGVRTYNFPSLHFRQRSRYSRQGGRVEEEARVRPSFTLFTTGKFVILGAKTTGQISEAFDSVTDWLIRQGWIARDLSERTASEVALHMDQVDDSLESEPEVADRYRVQRQYLATLNRVRSVVKEVEREEETEQPFASLTEREERPRADIISADVSLEDPTARPLAATE